MATALHMRPWVVALIGVALAAIMVALRFAFPLHGPRLSLVSRPRSRVGPRLPTVSLFRSARPGFVLLLASAIVLLPAVATHAIVRAAQSGSLCTEIAAATGLTFRSDYGSVVATDPLGRMMQRDMGNGVAVGDYDSDGYLDVYVLGQAGHSSRLYRNVSAPGGGRRFVDVTTAAGLSGQTGLSRVAFFVDLSGDGLLDLVVINDTDPAGKLPSSKIYRNNGDGTFSDVTGGSGFTPSGYIVSGAAVTDIDRNGLPDIFVSYWTKNLGQPPDTSSDRAPGQFPGRNRLFHNAGNFHFTDVTLSSGIGALSLDSFTPLFANFRGTSYPDLYLPMDYGEGDRFLKNVGGHFEDATDAVGAGHIGNDMGAAVADLNGTGDLAVYVTNITDPAHKFGVSRGNALLINQQTTSGVRFQDEAAAMGVSDTGWGWGATFVDINRDGYPDLYVVQGARNLAGNASPALRDGRAFLFLNDHHGRFQLTAGTGCDVHGDQRSLVVFDRQRNGMLDLLITQVNGPVLLLESRPPPNSHWLTVVCQGKGARCLGARITIRTLEHATGQVLLAGGSFLAGPPPEAYFGLGRFTQADLEVQWPSGQKVVMPAVNADQVVRLVAPPVSGSDKLGS